MSRERWNERYRTDSYTPREYPSDLLVENVEWLPAGRALDVATGTGRNAVFLAERGYRVDAIDISDAALSTARRRADERSVRVNWILGDVGHLPLRAEYDVVITSFFQIYDRLADLKSLLAPGGVLLYEHHLRSSEPVDRGPSSDDARYGSNDLLRLCMDLTILAYSETTRVFDRGDRRGQTATVASLVARNTSGGAQSYPPDP